MATAIAKDDPRMKEIEQAIGYITSIDGSASNLFERGKVTLKESKANKNAELDAAIKVTLTMAKGSQDVLKATANIIKAKNDLAKSGSFEAFAKTLKAETAIIAKTASAVKQFTTAISDSKVLIDLQKLSIFYGALKTYAESFLGAYLNYAKLYNNIVRFKDEASGGESKFKLSDVTDFLSLGGRVDDTNRMIISNVKIAQKDAKKLHKEHTDKKLRGELDKLSSNLEVLNKVTDKAIAAFSSMLKDVNKAEKGGSVDECVIAIRSKMGYFDPLEKNVDAITKSFKESDLKNFVNSSNSGFNTLSKTLKSFEGEYKLFKAKAL
jgi:hypothetical protein